METINHILRKNPSYIKMFSGFIDSDNTSIENVKTIYTKIRQYKQLFPSFEKNNFDSFEELVDYVDNTILASQRKNFVKRFVSAKYHDKLVNEDTILLFDTLRRETNELTYQEFHDLIIKKIASFNNYYDFNKMINDTINQLGIGWNTINILARISEVKAKIVYNENGIIICQTLNYEAMRMLGSPSWCIQRNEQTYQSYLTSEHVRNISVNNQYIIFNTNLPSTNRECKVGVTVYPEGSLEQIRACHNLDDSVANKSYVLQFKEYLKGKNREDFRTSLDFNNIDHVYFFNDSLETKRFLKNNIETISKDLNSINTMMSNCIDKSCKVTLSFFKTKLFTDSIDQIVSTMKNDITNRFLIKLVNEQTKHISNSTLVDITSEVIKYNNRGYTNSMNVLIDYLEVLLTNLSENDANDMFKIISNEKTTRYILSKEQVQSYFTPSNTVIVDMIRDSVNRNDSGMFVYCLQFGNVFTETFRNEILKSYAKLVGNNIRETVNFLKLNKVDSHIANTHLTPYCDNTSLKDLVIYYCTENDPLLFDNDVKKIIFDYQLYSVMDYYSNDTFNLNFENLNNLFKSTLADSNKVREILNSSNVNFKVDELKEIIRINTSTMLNWNKEIKRINSSLGQYIGMTTVHQLDNYTKNRDLLLDRINLFKEFVNVCV